MLEGTRVRLVLGRVRELDLVRRCALVELGNAGNPVAEAFDDVVLATGSVAATRGIPGIEGAWSCATEERGFALRDRLAGIRGGRVVIVGGGLTGIELATELAESRPDLHITLASGGDVAFMLSPRARANVRQNLERLRVELRERTRVVAIDRDAAILGSGGALPSDATVWCGGFEASPLTHEAGLATDDLGRAFVDPRLRSVSHDFVRIIGDAANVSVAGQPLRMACATAVPQGAFCADDIARELGSASSPPFSFAYAIQCLSLGRRHGIVQHVDAHDAPKRAWLGGRPGAWVKELICRYPVMSIGLERHGIGYSWPHAPALPSSSSHEATQLAARSH
jgi:NADH dehydrogenase FAD-containing subunit